jgi:hypothetical protein
MSPLTDDSLHSEFRDDLDNRVFEIVAKYEALREPSRILQGILRKSEVYGAFCEVVSHHLAIIRSRSQAFEDGKVTIFDKALVQLCQNGADVNNLGAHELYIEEFMGIDPKRPDTVDRNIALKGLLVKGCKLLNPTEISTSTLTSYVGSLPISQGVDPRSCRRQQKEHS